MRLWGFISVLWFLYANLHLFSQPCKRKAFLYSEKSLDSLGEYPSRQTSSSFYDVNCTNYDMNCTFYVVKYTIHDVKQTSPARGNSFSYYYFSFLSTHFSFFCCIFAERITRHGFHYDDTACLGHLPLSCLCVVVERHVLLQVQPAQSLQKGSGCFYGRGIAWH